MTNSRGQRRDFSNNKRKYDNQNRFSQQSRDNSQKFNPKKYNFEDSNFRDQIEKEIDQEFSSHNATNESSFQDSRDRYRRTDRGPSQQRNNFSSNRPRPFGRQDQSSSRYNSPRTNDSQFFKRDRNNRDGFSERGSGNYRSQDSRRDNDYRSQNSRRDGDYRSQDSRQDNGYRSQNTRRDGDFRSHGPRNDNNFRPQDSRRDNSYRSQNARRDGDFRSHDSRRDSDYRSQNTRQEGGYRKRYDNQYDSQFDRRPYSENTSWRKSDRFDNNKDRYERDFRNNNTPRFKNNYSDKENSQEMHPEKSKSQIRLNRYIANSGVCSRRDADDLILAGEIMVNGTVVLELGHKVSYKDKVEYRGKTLDPQKKVYLLLNKPKNTLCTFDDPEGRKTVYDLIKDATKERVYSVGRLDRNTTGLLLLTNNGDMTTALTHPSRNIKKLYWVTLDKNVSSEDLEKLRTGFDLEDGFIAADDVSYANNTLNEIGIEVHSGRNRIIRRMFEHLGYDVVKLDRVTFAGLTKKGIQRGEWRFLTTNEVNHLHLQIGKPKGVEKATAESKKRPRITRNKGE